MMLESVSLISVLGATIASIAVGFVWYGPLFGKQWGELMGQSKEALPVQRQKSMGKSYILMAIGSLIMSFILANFVQVAGALSLIDGMSVAFWAWLGFAVPLLLNEVLWQSKPMKLYLINIGYQLVSFVLMGAIVAAWS